MSPVRFLPRLAVALGLATAPWATSDTGRAEEGSRAQLSRPTATPPDEPVQQEPVQQEPVQQEPVQQEPVQQEPVQQEPVQQGPGELEEAYRRWRKELHQKLIELIDAGVPSEQIEPLLVPELPDRQVVFLNDASPDLGKQRAEAPAALQQLVTASAQELWTLARAMQADDPAMAHRWLHEILFLDPTHAPARQLLPPTEITVRTSRPRRRQTTWNWPADTYWELRSPNFLVLTNASPEAGERLVRQLETVEQVWSQLFLTYASSADEWQQRWKRVNELGTDEHPRAAPATADRPNDRPAAGSTSRRRARPLMRAVLFATREEYQRQLSPFEPQIALTLGYYSDRQTTAFYFERDGELEDAGEEAQHPLVSTWRHETVHQLFQQRRRGRAQLHRDEGLALVEGVAMYFESLREYSGYATLGGCDTPRLQDARRRALVDQFHVPWAELVSWGQESFQQHPEIRAVYSEAAGWAHFWLGHADRRYRDAYREALEGLYAGEALGAGLAAKVERDARQLDAEYLRFLRGNDEIFGPAWLLSEAVDWELAGTAISDQGLQLLDRAAGIRSLNLAGTAVTDDGLQGLAKLSTLRQLNLAGTAVTDATISRLMELPELESVDLRNTRVTAEGLGRLQQALPRLELTQ